MGRKPPRSSTRYRIRNALLSRAAAAVIRMLGATWRIRTINESGVPDPFAIQGPKIGAIWHRGLLIAAFRWRGSGMAVPVSRSRDGDLSADVLRRLGFHESPRGSSSRGASTLLRGLIRLVEDGTVVAMLPDGPRGPAREAKPGLAALAAATGAVVVPVAASARPCIRFGSWDRVLLPLPFARVTCIYGSPVRVPKKSGEELEESRRELQAALDALTDRLDRELDLPAEEATTGP